MGKENQREHSGFKYRRTVSVDSFEKETQLRTARSNFYGKEKQRLHRVKGSYVKKNVLNKVSQIKPHTQ